MPNNNNNQQNNQPLQDVDLFSKLREYFLHTIDLKEGTDKLKTISTIHKGIQIKGSTVWILICAATISSIGLDLNSAAVIIGAMLISPLMSPILGIGLSIGINDRETLWLSIQNFFIAISASILMSLLYFLLTPLGDLTPELAARTSPTLLDVGVALFGGIAGIVATSRKEQSTAIPGVAIATALMPPLCTVGYGLSVWDYKIWGGALYLFFINAVIIAFTCFLIVKFLHFPLKEYADAKDRAKTTLYVVLFVFAMIIPSIIILFNVLRQNSKETAAKTFIINEINTNGRKAFDWEFKEDTIQGKQLNVFFSGDPVSDSTKVVLENKLQSNFFNMQDVKLNLKSIGISSKYLKENINKSSIQQSTETAELVNEIVEGKLHDHYLKLSRANLNINDSTILLKLNDFGDIFPKLDDIALGYRKHLMTHIRDTLIVKIDSSLQAQQVDTIKRTDTIIHIHKTPVLFLNWNKSKKKNERKEDEAILYKLVRNELKQDTILMVSE